MDFNHSQYCFTTKTEKIHLTFELYAFLYIISVSDKQDIQLLFYFKLVFAGSIS